MRSQRGQALVEFALVLPFLVSLLVGLLLFGLGLHAKSVLTEAAAEGARVYAITGDAAAARDAAAEVIDQAQLPTSMGGLLLFDPDADISVAQDGTDGIVAITYRQPTLVPLGARLADPANPHAPWLLLQAQLRQRLEVQP